MAETTLDQNRIGEIAHDALGVTVYPGTEIMTEGMPLLRKSLCASL
jgi:hypothetical protein